MGKLWKVLPLTVAAAVLVLVWLQRSTIQRLDAELEARATRQGSSSAARPAAPEAAPQLEGRVASLEQTVARIFRMVLAAGQGRERPAERSAGSVSADERAVANLREDVDALLTGEVVNTEQGRKQLHNIVRDVQEEIWQERRQRFETMRAEMRRARVQTLAEQAGLSGNQVERLNTLLDDERTQGRALRRTGRSGELPFPQVMEQMRTLRQATDQKARELLDSAQYAEYEKMRQERRDRHGH